MFRSALEFAPRHQARISFTASRVAVSLLSVSIFSGCSYLSAKVNDGSSNTPIAQVERGADAGSSSSGLSTTGVGAATGAVLGGGIGAIVGSTSGDAGAGLAIGATAGAVAGGVIGNSLQESQKGIQGQQAKLREQDSLIQEQRQQLDQLKRDSRDSGPRSNFQGNESSRSKLSQGRSRGTFASNGKSLSQINSFNRPSRGGQSYSMNSYRGNPRAVPFSRADVTAKRTETARTSASSTLSAVRPATLTKNTTAASHAPIRATLPTSTASSADTTETHAAIAMPAQVTQKLPTAKIEPAVTASNDAPTQLDGIDVGGKEIKETAAAPQAAVSGNSLPPAKQTPPIATAETTAAADIGAVASAAEEQGNCAQAESEAELAKNAATDSDRLFYLRRASKLCPSNADYQLDVGKVYGSLGRTAEAKSSIERALQLNPKLPGAHEALSSIK